MMANTNPTISDKETLEEVLTSAAKENIHVKSVATITKNFDGENITDFKGLLEAGAVGFSDDGIPLTNASIVKKAMELARRIIPLSAFTRRILILMVFSVSMKILLKKNSIFVGQLV